MFWRVLIAGAVLVPAVAAWAADELPAELLLSCEGKMNAVMDVPSPQTRDANFRINLRLKDGVATDTLTGVVEGTGCVQSNGEVKCEVTKVYPLASTTVKRFSTVMLNRNTRELTLWVESWEYPGGTTSGAPSAHLRVLRTGLCRDDALF